MGGRTESHLLSWFICLLFSTLVLHHDIENASLAPASPVIASAVFYLHGTWSRYSDSRYSESRQNRNRITCANRNKTKQTLEAERLQREVSFSSTPDGCFGKSLPEP